MPRRSSLPRAIRVVNTAVSMVVISFVRRINEAQLHKRALTHEREMRRRTELTLRELRQYVDALTRSHDWSIVGRVQRSRRQSPSGGIWRHTAEAEL